MLDAPLGYKIMFEFDMPDGSKFWGIMGDPTLSWISRIYRSSNGQNLVIRDETIYIAAKDSESDSNNSTARLIE